MNPILVTCYVNPDLDGLAGAMAYGEFLQKSGQNAVVSFIGQIHDEAKYILDRFNFIYPKIISQTDNFEKIILVDASDLNGLDNKILPDKVIEIIDHRKINEADKFPNANVQIELVGAAATLVTEKFMQNNVSISLESAVLLYSAIISNTLNFKGSVTTERDQVAAKWLNKYAQLPENFWQEVFLAKSDLSGEKLAQRIEGDFACFDLHNKKIGIAQIEIIGADKLINERGQEIIKILNKLKTELNLDFIFQNTIELQDCKNYLIADDENTKKILEESLDINFQGICAERNGLIMRKQIVPLLKETLGKN